MHTFSAAQSLSWMFGDQSPNSRRVCSLIRLRAGRATVWPCRCVGFTSLKIAPIISNLSVYVNALHGICNLVAQRCIRCVLWAITTIRTFEMQAVAECNYWPV